MTVTKARRTRRARRVHGVLLLLCALTFLLIGRRAGAEDRVLAVFLPGVHFASLEQRLELGNELATHLSAKLGERYRLTPRVYSSADAMEADAGRIALALVESPYVAARLATLPGLHVAGQSYFGVSMNGCCEQAARFAEERIARLERAPA